MRVCTPLNSPVWDPAHVGKIPLPLLTHPVRAQTQRRRRAQSVKGRHGELVLEEADHAIEVEGNLAGYPSP